jgi:hypothetical protein
MKKGDAAVAVGRYGGRKRRKRRGKRINRLSLFFFLLVFVLCAGCKEVQETTIEVVVPAQHIHFARLEGQ